MRFGGVKRELWGINTDRWDLPTLFADKATPSSYDMLLLQWSWNIMSAERTEVRIRSVKTFVNQTPTFLKEDSNQFAHVVSLSLGALDLLQIGIQLVAELFTGSSL